MTHLSSRLATVAVGLSLAVSLTACDAISDLARSNEADADLVPVMRWDHRPEGGEWTRTAFAALDTYASALPDTIPADISEWCPGYPNASEEEREAFWVGLMSALARHESTWNPDAVGGGGQWFGLVQISPATARNYGCSATTGSALTDGAANVSCAMRIWARTVTRDGVVAAGRGGVAADWGPFVQSEKREEMRAWVSSQPYCQA